jgi:hypothetical protein
MVFHPPSWIPQLPIEPPDSISILDFMRDEKYGRYPLTKSSAPFTCGLTGKSYSAVEFFERSEYLARSFSKRLAWQPNEGTPWDKVACIFALNNVSHGRCCDSRYHVDTGRLTISLRHTASIDSQALLRQQTRYTQLMSLNTSYVLRHHKP